MVNNGLVCSLSKNSLSSFCSPKGLVLAQVLNLSRNASLSPKRILKHFFCARNSGRSLLSETPPQTVIGILIFTFSHLLHNLHMVFLDSLMHGRLDCFCELKNIIDEEQEGFRPKHSTTRYLYRLMSSLKDAQKKKLNAIILCIDLQKAFDSVWIPGLIYKLRGLGIDGPIIKLINSFLSTRHISLKINNFIGKSRKCTLYGLPQGSVLSPFSKPKYSLA